VTSVTLWRLWRLHVAHIIITFLFSRASSMFDSPRRRSVSASLSFTSCQMDR